MGRKIEESQWNFDVNFVCIYAISWEPRYNSWNQRKVGLVTCEAK